MSPDERWRLQNKRHYTVTPTLKENEELVEYREAQSDGSVHIVPGEIIIGTDGGRYSYEHISKKKPHGVFNTTGRGRYIVRKKDGALRGTTTGKCALCGGQHVLGRLAEHYSVCPRKCGASPILSKQPESEVVMAEQKPLNYKRDTLIEALKNAVAENEKKRAEDKKRTAEKTQKAADQLIDLMNANPLFAQNVLARAAALVGADTKSMGTDLFKESVEEKYPSLEGSPEFDAELKKLIRVYEKAEDETVEVHVHDTVYNYL